MIITIFGATGMVGKKLVTCALNYGHIIKAFGRNIEALIDQDLRSDRLEAIKGYVFDEADVYEAVKGSDAVISALGGSFDGTDKTRSLGIKNIVVQMRKAGVKRLVVLGGMGVLNAGDGTLLIDRPGYPEIYLPVGREHLRAWKSLEESALDWTFVAAPDIVDAGETGHYNTRADTMPSSAANKISAGDLAAFMVNEAEAKQYLHQKVGISN